MKGIFTDENLKQYVDTNQIQFYIKEIFKNCIDYDTNWMMELRKIGQYRFLDETQPDGFRTEQAEQSTAAQIIQFNQQQWIEDLAVWVSNKCLASAPIGIGCFMAPAILDDRRANDQSVKLLATICADFDSGDPQDCLEAAIAVIGVRPTIVAASGGVTPEGKQKLHAHWRLDEPCDEPWKVAYIREQIAKKFGADTSFKRIPQVIRIPGALYDKGFNWSMTNIVEYNNIDISLLHIEEVLDIDYDHVSKDSILTFDGKKKTIDERNQRLHQLQTEEVHAGRTDDTRFDRFGEYAGHQIRQARFGHQTEEEAYNSVCFWVNDKMRPPWDNVRVQKEFHALLNRDKANYSDAWADKNKPPLILTGVPFQNSENSNNSDIADWDEPEPLIEKIDYVEYPIDALPDVMYQAAMEYQNYAQIPMAMAGGILLASASLAVQGLVNVRRDNALCGPVTLNIITIAESGERKTSADKILGAGVREWEQEAEEIWKKTLKKYKAEEVAHQKKVKGLERSVTKEAENGSSKNLGNMEHQLTELLLNPPKKPVKPVLFYMDFTVEALIAELADGFPVASAWTDEAGIIVGGHSLREGALAAFAIFNVLWDGKDYKVNRKTVSNAYVRGRRLSLNLSMQKDVFNHLCGLEGGKSRSTGWMARSLLSMPVSTIGTRMFKEAQDMPSIEGFNAILKDLLDLLPNFSDENET